MAEETLIKTAEFSPKVCTYWLVSGAMTLVLTVVGIPFLLLWFPLGLYVTQRYLDRMDCELTDKALKVRKGIFVRIEKTIPLEKITDIGMVQGPIMRAFDIHRLTVETAGQSGPGALVALTGIKDAKAFRALVLDQRLAIGSVPGAAPVEVAAPATGDSSALLSEIRDSLLRIEATLEKTNS